MNFSQMRNPLQSWRPFRGGARDHRPIQVCESCRQDWPCDEELNRLERQRRNTQIIETILAERRKR